MAAAVAFVGAKLVGVQAEVRARCAVDVAKGDRMRVPGSQRSDGCRQRQVELAPQRLQRAVVIVREGLDAEPDKVGAPQVKGDNVVLRGVG